MQLLQVRRTPTPDGNGGNNGGFPLPPSGEPSYVVASYHPTCGSQTQVRLPLGLDESIIHRVTCDGCGATYEHDPTAEPPSLDPLAGIAPLQASAAVSGTTDEAGEYLETEPAAAPNPTPLPSTAPDGGDGGLDPDGQHPSPSDSGSPYRAPSAHDESIIDRIRLGGEDLLERASIAFDAARERLGSGGGGGAGSGDTGFTTPFGEIPRNRLWAWASVPIAAVAVVLMLSLIQGGSDPVATSDATAEQSAEGAGAAKVISEPGFVLAMPKGWTRTDPPEGAIFGAEPRRGGGEVALWIERNPNMTMNRFERRSLSQLREIATNVRVVDRVDGPSVDNTIIEIAGDVPVADGVFSELRVTLRAAGPYRHYLSSALDAGSPAKLVADVERMHSSIVPEVLESAGEVGQ